MSWNVHFIQTTEEKNIHKRFCKISNNIKFNEIMNTKDVGFEF